jgi:hypothetical protein
MKALIKTTRKITKSELSEVKVLLDMDFTIDRIKDKPVPVWNPYHKLIEIDWTWHRSLFSSTKTDIRCYCTTQVDLKKSLITKYLGLYNHLDKDKVSDFWFGVPTKLQSRAKKNGFKTNFAWLFIHEYLHGKLLLAGKPDIVHEMEKQGRLKELLAKESATPSRKMGLMAQIITLMTQAVSLLQAKAQSTDTQPKVARMANEIVTKMRTKGYEVMVFQGFRSVAEQDYLYAQGRTRPGKVVTNAKGGESFHNYGVAVDIVFVKNGNPSWAESHPWDLLGTVGKSVGFDWGGLWPSFPDRPHFQHLEEYTLSDFQEGAVNYNKFN